VFSNVLDILSTLTVTIRGALYLLRSVREAIEDTGVEPIDIFVLYHLVWRDLLHGAQNRPALPAEIVMQIFRFARITIPDPARKLSIQRKVSVKADSGIIETKRWFSTQPLTRTDVAQLADVQLVTFSRDQGFGGANSASYSWFELGVLPNQFYQTRAREDDDNVRWIISHDNIIAHRHPVLREGIVISNEEAGWAEGDVLVVRICAQYPNWENIAESGTINYWTWFEPKIQL
jgi:hypothetical protein